MTLEKGRSAVYSHRLRARGPQPDAVMGEYLQYAAHLPGGPLARVETGFVIARHVPCATHRIVDVFAEPGRLGPVLASTETKLVGSDEILREKPVDEPSPIK